jgi:hypothetical protein
MKVFAMSSGEWSDYGIDALFTTRDLAEEAIRAKSAADRYVVEEFELYDRIPEKVTLFSVYETLLDDGSTEDFSEDVESGYPWDNSEWFAENGSDRPTFKSLRAPYLNGRGVRVVVSGRSREKVMKAYHDRKREWASSVRLNIPLSSFPFEEGK